MSYTPADPLAPEVINKYDNPFQEYFEAIASLSEHRRLATGEMIKFL